MIAQKGHIIVHSTKINWDKNKGDPTRQKTKTRSCAQMVLSVVLKVPIDRKALGPIQTANSSLLDLMRR